MPERLINHHHRATNAPSRSVKTLPPSASLIRKKRLIKLQRGRLPGNRNIHTGPIRLLRANTMFRNRTIKREPARRPAHQRQRRRRRSVNVRTHAARLGHRDRKRGRQGRGRGAGEVGDGRVDGVGGDGGVEGRVGGEGGKGGGDGRQGRDGEHGVLEGPVLAGRGEAGEAGAGGEGQGEGVRVRGAPDAGAGVGRGDGGGDGRGGRLAGAVDEGDAFCFGQHGGRVVRTRDVVGVRTLTSRCSGRRRLRRFGCTVQSQYTVRCYLCDYRARTLKYPVRVILPFQLTLRAIPYGLRLVVDVGSTAVVKVTP